MSLPLQTLLGVLRESHRVRVQFRRVGGYLGLLSMLLSLEHSFASALHESGSVPTSHCEILEFIHLVFKVLTISMRFEPSNAKYFSIEVCLFPLTGSRSDGRV